MRPADGGGGRCGRRAGSSREPPARRTCPSRLPSLEDLTADGDLSAFLREGVPAALRNAAMRKMWSLDPAIRDYVGLSEYAWDFNKPGAMTGFGPLEAGRAVADFLSTVSRETPADPEEAPPAPEAPAVAPEPAASLPPDEPAEASGHAGRRLGRGRRRESAEATGTADAIPNAAQATPWRRRAAVGRPLFPFGFSLRRGCNNPIGGYYDLSVGSLRGHQGWSATRAWRKRSARWAE